MRLQERLPARREAQPERAQRGVTRPQPGSSYLGVSGGRAASRTGEPWLSVWGAVRLGTLTLRCWWQRGHSAPFRQSDKGISCPPL